MTIEWAVGEEGTMSRSRKKAPLEVRLRGPGVDEGRVLLNDLVLFGRQLQTAVDRVAHVLAGEATSARPGRRPGRIRSACALEVVSLSSGSVVLGLDLRRDQPGLPGLDVGEAALERLLDGLGGLAEGDESLPAGYDLGVLAAWREAGKVFGHGIDEVEFSLKTARRQLVATYGRGSHATVVRRIQGPVTRLRTVEGRLLMADFRDASPRCRVHPPLAPPVECEFDEELAESVYDNLRSYVSVTGETEEDPETGRIRRLRIVDVEPVPVAPEGAAEPVEDFWSPSPLEQLAVEQGLTGPQTISDLVGAGAALWADDGEFEAFVQGVYERRRESRVHEGGEA